MATTTVRVNSRGTVHLPAAARREAGFAPNDELVLIAEDGQVTLTTRAHLRERLRAAAPTREGDPDAVTAIRHLREADADHVDRRLSPSGETAGETTREDEGDSDPGAALLRELGL